MGAAVALYYRGSATLAYGVRGRVMLRYMGQLAIAMAGLPAVPGAFALALRDLEASIPYLALTAGLIAGGLLLGRVPATTRLQKNEALAVTALTFIGAGLMLSWPFSAAAPGYLDALFEAVSAITTTGLSTLPTVEGASPVFLFARAWAQWYGGLVIVALAVAVVIEPGTVATRLSADEFDTENLAGGARVRARRGLIYYSAITAAGVIVLMLLGVPAFEALLHVLAAVSTGGFSSHDASIAALAGGEPAHAVVSILSVLGAVSFSLVFVAWRRGWRVIARDLELRAIIALVVIVALAVTAVQHWAAPAGQAVSIGQALVIAVSAQTTTGFSNIDVAALGEGSKLALIFSMVIGGDAGSTAGGIKLGRALVLVSVVGLALFRAALPAKAVTHVSVSGKRVDSQTLEGVMAITLVYAAAIGAGWFAFAVGGHGGIDGLFEVTSALATTGLSSGLTGPALAPALKLVLCALMLMGRLEVVAILILLYHRTWFSHRARSS